MTGKVLLSQVNINTSYENRFIEPNQTISFNIEEIYQDERGNEAEVLVTEGFTIEVDKENLVNINEDNSITVLGDVLSGEDIVIIIEYKDNKHKTNYTVRKGLESTLNEDGVIINPSDYDAIVNKSRSLPADYIPNDLVKLRVPTQLQNPEINQLRKVAADALFDLFEQGKKEGYTLVARSGYRSYLTQQSLYYGNVESKGQAHADKYSAPPGKSEHQTGLAMDITSADVAFQLSTDFGHTEEGIWVNENAHKFGFIIRYPKGKESIVGYEYEPWHIRYVGVELATKIFESDLTMEEYFELPM
ncbi:D-alanyl-D-alanine carboxypeptidase family protein [Alkalibaculum sp. M08DMB]|uniref:D-alanyl-D-alanine carboxypeptidase family protein n=2 Tax=Alkalibaculum sporogenes TaxID=2655001 RepID=A0A6A7KCP9_9FIRM|nr:D-alanyl-D-alanine carboxypeptidase family protein [Alkalibaculum sporogenes]